MAVTTTTYGEIPAPGASVRALVAQPAAPAPRGGFPVVIAWSDIFQLTPSHVRLVRRLAGHGFVVVAPELYAHREPPGTVLDFDRDRQRALDAAAATELAWIDGDRAAALAYARSLPAVDPARLMVCGWCFGGHLAFRAALDPGVRAAACFYPTGLHNGTVGAAQGTADTLARAGEIRGEVLLAWGRRDPHIPAAGRALVHRALDDAGARYEARMYDGEHAFMRDEGSRFDAEATDLAFGAMLALFRRTT